MLGVGTVNALGNLPLLLDDLEIVRHMNTPDEENATVFSNFARGLRCEASVMCRNAARLQRAPESAGQSTCGGSHHVIKCGGVRFLRSRIYPIVLRYLRVKPEECRLPFYRKIRTPQSPLHALNPHD